MPNAQIPKSSKGPLLGEERPAFGDNIKKEETMKWAKSFY
jgi:hypothetical protein